MKGTVKATIAGYIYMDIAGKIFVNKYIKISENEIRIISFGSITADFRFEDTADGDFEEMGFAAVIKSVKVTRLQDNQFETEAVIDIY